MGRLSSAYDRLAPPMLVPSAPHTLTVSQDYAKPSSYSSSSDESARDALIQVLHKSGDPIDDWSHDQNDKSHDMDPDDLLHHQRLLNSATMLPSLDFSLATKYNTNITHLPVLQQSPGKFRRRKNRSASSLNTESNSVITKAVSAEILDKILSDENAEGNIHEQSQKDGDIPLFDIEDCATEKSENQTAEQTTQTDSQTPTETVHVSPVESVDSGYSTLKSEIERHKAKVEKSISGQDGGQRKSSHYRSMSDYGVTSGSSQLTNQNNSNRSSSTSTLPDFSRQENRQAVQQASFFHQPEQGESLIGFLSSQDFHTAAELDKENAHFSICETLIAAIEQMKFNQVLNPAQNDDVIEGDSDEEIQALKQRIRIRRRERLKEKARGFPAFSDGRTDTTTTSSVSQYSDDEDSLPTQESDSSSEEIHDASLNEADTTASSDTNLSSLKASGLSLSMASLYSDAELKKSNAMAERNHAMAERNHAMAERNHTKVVSYERSDELGGVLPDGTLVFPQNTQVSAESVAISLLKRFSEKQLPKASDLEWLVSEQDAPQQLLPLPDSYPVSPDDYENADLLTSGKRTRLRGNLEWAPPRAQIIFNIHPATKRQVLMASQNYRCAGCGTKVQPAYMKRYRYCEYLGKYFCPCCHSNDVAYIPGRVIRKWDFTKYSVSHFARDLLAKIENEPLFSIEDLNPNLYRKVKGLEQIRQYRKQLTHLVAFLKTCRLGTRLLEIIEGEPTHWTIDPHVYTLRELVNVKKALLLPRIGSLVNEALSHVHNCELCQAKGFICELCSDSKPIFPFDLERVKQCDLCRACYHADCYVPDKCPKCARIELRRQRVNESIAED